MKFTNLKGADIVIDETRLAEFNKHKESLLDLLRNQYERGPKSKSFDEDKAWGRLIGLAQSCFGHHKMKKGTIPAADRIERLRDIAQIVRRASRLVDRTMQTDVGNDLFLAWWEVTGNEHAEPDGTFDPGHMEQKFRELVKSLEALESAASYGADHVAAGKRGRRPVLPWDDIWNLGVVYRDSTGLVPGAGDGPFAKFVMSFFLAVGRPDEIEYDSIIEAIKDARQWALRHPVARKWGPSPFD